MPSIKLHSDILLRPLQAASGIVERRNTLPILGHVLLTVTQQGLSVVATDLQLQITQHVHLDTTALGEMAVTVPARKLLDILRALPPGELELSHTGERLILRRGGSRFSLQTLAVETFHAMAQAAAFETRLSLPQKAFRQMLSRVHFAMAQQDIRYYMNGMQLLVEDTQLSVVALDGCRLAWASLATEEGSPRHEAIVPRKTVLELLRLLTDSDDPLQIEIAGEQIRFSFGAIALVSKLIDARFPDVQRAIPRNYAHALTVAREPWLKALQRVAILSSEKFRSVRFLVEPGRMTLRSNNGERDEAEEELAIEYDGAGLEIGFNLNYLLDVLAQLETDSINLQLDQANLSALLMLPGQDNYKYVAMALRN